MMGYGDEHGDLDFRKMISQMLNHQRGMHILENEISITRGSQMGMFLTAQSLLSPGDMVVVEDPAISLHGKRFSMQEHSFVCTCR